MNERPAGLWVIALTLVAALMLNMLPLPDWAAAYHPDWLALVLIYWCMALPTRVGVLLAWTMGLLQDVAQGSLLGQHALGYALIAFLVVEAHRRIRVFPLWQQALVVLVLLTLKQLLIAWVDGMTGHAPTPMQVFLPPLTGMLLWPWVFVVLRHVRRRYGVA